MDLGADDLEIGRPDLERRGQTVPQLRGGVLAFAITGGAAAREPRDDVGGQLADLLLGFRRFAVGQVHAPQLLQDLELAAAAAAHGGADLEQVPVAVPLDDLP
jgi:hypothetical protein